MASFYRTDDFKKLGLSKSKIVNDLFKKGIGTQVHYIPLFLQPFYKNKDKNIYKGSLEYYSKNLSLPMAILWKEI